MAGQIREIVAAANLLWLFLVAALIVTFTLYLNTERRAPGWHQSPVNRVAIGLTFYLVGTEIMRLTSLAFALQPSFVRPYFVWPFLVAAGLAITGAACCIRVFSPRWAMLIIGASVVVTAIGTAVIFIDGP